MKIPVDSILPNPEQPRKDFSQVELKELAESIRINDLMNAISVEEAGDGMFFILDGERRWRAHKMLGLKEIEATVHPPQTGGSKERLMKALVANCYRVDLSPIEEAKAYKRLVDLGESNTTIAHYAGVSLPKISSRLKLLELDPEIQDLISAGRLPTDIRSTDAILSIRKADDQVKMARRLARKGIRIKTIIHACQHYNQVLQKPKEKLDIPAVDLARDKAGRFEGKLPAWSILQANKQLPLWSDFRAAADKTCKACELRDFASEETCRSCPAVELTKKLMEIADEKR